jgi:hypothetical protein
MPSCIISLVRLEPYLALRLSDDLLDEVLILLQVKLVHLT